MENHLYRLNIANYIMIIFFLGGCVVSPVLVNDKVVTKEAAFYYVGISVLIFVLIENFTLIVIYCKYSGLPFKTENHQKSLRHIGWIVIYWTCVSIIMKMLTSLTPLAPDEFKKHFKEEE